VRAPFLTKPLIVNAASALLSRALGDRAGQVPVDLETLVYDYLCEREGLVFVEDRPLASHEGHEVLGLTELVAGRIFVCSNLKARDLARFRFTLAHEIGHWVLHRPLALERHLRDATTMQEELLVSVATLGDEASSNLDSIEWQANYFASHLLIPRAPLRREFAERFGGAPLVCPQGSDLGSFAREISRRAMADQPSLSRVFLASVTAMGIALKESGLVVLDPVLL